MNNLVSARRIQGIGEYYFSRKLQQIDAIRKQGMEVLNLGIGSPDLPPHPSVIAEFNSAILENGAHQYQSYKGLPELRSAIANWYQRYFDCQLDSDREVLPLIGSKEGITHICMSMLDDGDSVLIPNPGYPAYETASKMAGADIIHYDLKEENQYQPDFEALEKMDLASVKIMWVNYPHMPTGSSGSTELFDKLIHFIRKHNIVLINDNPYAFILTERPVSLLSACSSEDHVLELNSLSKSHNMAGWRVGMLVGNQELIETVLTFKSQVDSGQFKPMLKAAIKALTLDERWFDALNEVYHSRKQMVHKILDALNCTYHTNSSGMFVWGRIPDTEEDAEHFSDMLLEQHKIFVPPGSVFGSNGKRYIRFSLCSPESVWNETLNRLNETK
ncbi:pyridoxal phosphate-dependent aminotransferase [Ekhidna sp.]|uniref:pyridoxal phosphate-dependent aminotransferase n=1 Tax=Ekhidna sp. TaxID=2608089 RepID=UPI003BAB8AF9